MYIDPHGGNLLACPDGRLCYLDFGMMSYVDRSQRNGFLLAVVHIVNRDWPELVRVYQKLVSSFLLFFFGTRKIVKVIIIIFLPLKMRFS